MRSVSRSGVSIFPAWPSADGNDPGACERTPGFPPRPTRDDPGKTQQTRVRSCFSASSESRKSGEDEGAWRGAAAGLRQHTPGSSVNRGCGVLPIGPSLRMHCSHKASGMANKNAAIYGRRRRRNRLDSGGTWLHRSASRLHLRFEKKKKKKVKKGKKVEAPSAPKQHQSKRSFCFPLDAERKLAPLRDKGPSRET